MSVIRDITERKRSEAALRSSEQQYRSIFDFATVGIYQSRDDGSLITANAKLAEILGYDSPEELLAVNLKDVYRNPGGREALTARYGALDTALRVELEWKRKDGMPIWVELNAHGIRGERGEFLCYEGFVLDVTERRHSEEERRALEQKLVQSQKMEVVGQLAGGIAHDFNNLLSVITGYTELLIGSLDAKDLRLAHAEEIRRAAQRAASLTHQLLAFSRKQVLEPKVLDLNEVLSGLEVMLRRLIPEHIELRIRKDPDLRHARADPGQLEQAILNLVVNARDAMPDGGRLTIETANAELDPVYASTREPTQPGHYVMIAVTDSGIGMTPEVKARLFEPFFTTKELGKGTGLGLSTTYGIIKQSGGYIWCYSEPGHGTAFKIYLPRTEESGVHAAATVPAPAPAAASGGGESILLVEDQPELRYLLLRLLKMQGYAVMAAANPEEAVAITRDFKGAIHLMVTDVVMPGMNGPQLADQIVGSRPDMKVLFMSGYTDDAIVRHGLVAEERSFLQKPFTPHVLLARLREVLDSKATCDA